MKPWPHGLAIIGCTGLVLLAMPMAGGLLLGGMLWLASERTIYGRSLSPDKWHEARAQFDDCGAPCGWSKAVYVKQWWLPGTSPWFSCRAFVGDGTSKVRLAWLSNDKLLISHGFSSDHVFGVQSCGSVNVKTRFDRTLISEEP
ncbi:hypothetical protein [Sphingomonas sp. 1185]|uniref:hypothetical protein n=1 Tax=Sphingomonas sp. 1185 TaxID=3156411 RepID=UPI003392571D